MKLIDQLYRSLRQGPVGGPVILMILWPVLFIPRQDYLSLLLYAAIGAGIGLLIFLVIILPLLLLAKRRQKRLAAKPAQEAVTPPSMPAISPETVETAPVMIADEPVTIPITGPRPVGIGWRIAGLTDVGCKRELNEDSILLAESDVSGNSPMGLYAVADGMGGHEKGEVASQLTLVTLRQRFAAQPPLPADAPFEEWLKNAAINANETLLARQQPDEKERKMGSTLVMALVSGRQAHIANVGDSRAYYLNAEGIHQISEDHSLVQRLVQIGQITREEARVHRQKNVIYNTIGDKPKLEVSLYHVTLAPGERLLLCSDGLSGMITDDEILTLSRQYAAPAEACQALVKAAKAAGGDDNITGIIVQMDAA